MKFPAWVPVPDNYGRAQLRYDLLAGVTVGILLIPQAMAYALLAGVPPVYGIYASLLPMALYALLGSTPHVSVGPTALASILALAMLGQFYEPGTDAYISAILLLAGMTGVVQLLFGFFRLGVLVSFLSRPVVSGFVSAAAVLIVFSQLKSLLGVEMPRSSFLHEALQELWLNLRTWHWPTTLVSLGSIGFLLGMKRWAPRWPATLILLLFTVLLSAWWKLDQKGLEVVGELPNGLPSFYWPEIENLDAIIQLLPAALVLALISFVETLSIGKTIAERHDYYRISPNRELIALGAGKLLGAFFQGIPTSASFSRSAVGEQNGAKTFLHGLFAVFLVGLAALFIMDWFYYLPLAALAAIIVVSVGGLFDWREMVRLWQLDKKDWASLIVTFLVTLFGGLQFGIAAGVLLSLGFFILKSVRPHLAELGRLPGTNAFRNLNRFAKAQSEADVLIVRFDGELYFGNADFFRDQLLDLVQKKGPELRLVIIDAHTISDLDTSGAYVLEKLVDYLHTRRINLVLTGTIGPVRDRLFKLGIMDLLGVEQQFLSIQDALQYYRGAGDDRDWDQPALQHT